MGCSCSGHGGVREDSGDGMDCGRIGDPGGNEGAEDSGGCGGEEENGRGELHDGGLCE